MDESQTRQDLLYELQWKIAEYRWLGALVFAPRTNRGTLRPTEEVQEISRTLVAWLDDGLIHLGFDRGPRLNRAFSETSWANRARHVQGTWWELEDADSRRLLEDFEQWSDDESPVADVSLASSELGDRTDTSDWFRVVGVNLTATIDGATPGDAERMSWVAYFGRPRVPGKERDYVNPRVAHEVDTERILGNMAAGMSSFVARDGDDVVGYCQVALINDWKTLEELYVRPSHLGTDVGYRLLQRAIGGSASEAWVPESATRAAAFLSRNGFDADGRLRPHPTLPEIELVHMIRREANDSPRGLG